MHQLETLFEATVDKDFDKFEIYVLRNILTVSDDVLPWMRLGHYEVCMRGGYIPFCFYLLLGRSDGRERERERADIYTYARKGTGRGVCLEGGRRKEEGSAFCVERTKS